MSIGHEKNGILYCSYVLAGNGLEIGLGWGAEELRVPLGVVSREKGKHQNDFGCQVLVCWVPLRPSDAGEVALQMLGHGGKHWGRAELFPFSQPAYLPAFLSPPLVSVQIRQTGTKTPWGTISSCDKEEECSKHRLLWKAWDHCHPLPADTGALEETVGSGALPTVLCRGTEAFKYKRLLGAAEKNSRKWKSVFTVAFKDRMAHSNQGLCALGMAAMEGCHHCRHCQGRQEGWSCRVGACVRL